jgi:antitoxin component of RelBE/YafQ-DinJ toxin-antitoxin module
VQIEDFGWDDPKPAPKPRRNSEKRRRNAVISVRVNIEELTAVEAAAKNAGVSVSAYMRTCALYAALHQDLPRVEVKQDEQAE